MVRSSTIFLMKYLSKSCVHGRFQNSNFQGQYYLFLLKKNARQTQTHLMWSVAQEVFLVHLFFVAMFWSKGTNWPARRQTSLSSYFVTSKFFNSSHFMVLYSLNCFMNKIHEFREFYNQFMVILLLFTSIASYFYYRVFNQILQPRILLLCPSYRRILQKVSEVQGFSIFFSHQLTLRSVTY